MNTVLSPLLCKGVLVFMDDMLVHCHTWPEHMTLLRAVLKILLENGLKAKLSKCTFAQNRINYLGDQISQAGVTTDTTKIQAVRNWPRPYSVRKLRGFLGLAGYYRKFVRNFGIISRPLTDMLKKGTVFVWTLVADTSFKN